MNPTQKIIKDLEKGIDSPKKLIEAVIEGTTKELKKNNIHFTLRPETEEFLKAIDELKLVDIKDVEQSLNNYFENLKKEIDEEKRELALPHNWGFNKGLQKAKEIILGNKDNG